MAVLSLIPFFVAGLGFLMWINEGQARRSSLVTASTARLAGQREIEH
jgi:hypothetical protein